LHENADVWTARDLGRRIWVAAQEEILPGRYEQPRLVGRGGMGEIYLAHDRMLGRTVAVKLLAERLAEDPELRERFRREALTAARLSSEPHVVTIFDVGEHEGRPFTVMEYLPGGTLAGRLRGPVAPAQALSWLTQAAEALDAAHAHGVVHRDVKPANLLFDGSDRLQVVDFGIARLVDETLGMTAPGTILGTAGYLAPEQASGRETTAASDRYALAVVAYELLTGRRPFERGSETAEAAAHIHEPVPPPSEEGVGLPESVDAVFARALAKNPVHRYPTAIAFVDALADGLRGTALPPAQPPARRRGALGLLAVAAAILLALGGVAAALVARGDDGQTPAASPELQTVTRQITVEQQPTTVVQTITDAPTETEPLPAPPGQLSVEEAAALNDQAFGLMQDGEWEQALPLLEEAVKGLKNTYSDDFRYEAYAEYNLGRTLAELGDCKQARHHLDRSEKLQGERTEIDQARALCEKGER
jgi:tRNA A-37 threonylcarbamoyl transferase component Bud32